MTTDLEPFSRVLIGGLGSGVRAAREHERHERHVGGSYPGIGADDSGWGLINTLAGLGGLLTVAGVGLAVRRLNVRRLAVIGATLMLPNTPLLGAS